MAHTNKKVIKQLERDLAKAKSDNDKIELMNSVAISIEYDDSNRAETLYKEAFQLSQNIQYHQGIAKSAKHLCVFYSQILGNSQKALEYAEIALPIFRQLEDLNGESRLLSAIGKIYMEYGDCELASYYFKEGIKQASTVGDTVVECNCNFHLGTMYKNLSRFDEALECFHKASLLLDKNDTHKESLIYNNIGIIKYHTGDYGQALYYYFKSLKIKKLLSNQRGMANTLNNIANIYTDLCDYENALENYHQSLEIKHKNKDSHGAANTLLNIGTIYHELKNYSDALKYYKEALSIYSDLHLNFKIPVAMVCIGDVLIEEGKIDEGLDILINGYKLSKEVGAVHNLATACINISKAFRADNVNEALKFAHEGLNYSLSIKDNQQLPKHFLNLSTIYLCHHNYEQSLEFALKALEKSKEQADKLNLIASLQAASLAHEKIGNYKEALSFYKEFNEANEQVFNENSMHKVNTILAQFNTQRMQNEHEILSLKSIEFEKQAQYFNRELQLIALNLVEKNEFLRQVKSLVQKNVTAKKSDYAKLIANIDANVSTKEEWQTFKQKFDRAHDEFIQRLSKEFPQLTPMELKVAALLRIHMENKDIANLLYASVRTIEGHRLNIRKKLGLGLKDNLSVFLAGW